MELAQVVALAAQAVEGVGVAVIVGGALVAGVRVGVRIVRHRADGAYQQLRGSVGRAILLGLELLVGADIIRTVGETPTLHKVAVLGLIVLIRTFLSVSLQLEVEGRWPWQPPSETVRSSGRTPEGSGLQAPGYGPGRPEGSPEGAGPDSSGGT